MFLQLNLMFTPSCAAAFGLIVDQHCTGSVHNGSFVNASTGVSGIKHKIDSEAVTDWIV